MCFNLDILLSASLAIPVTLEETKTKIEAEKASKQTLDEKEETG